MRSLLLALSISQTLPASEVIEIPIPNLRWVAPTNEPGGFMAMAERSYWARTFYLGRKGKIQEWFTTEAAASDPVQSPDRRWVVFPTWKDTIVQKGTGPFRVQSRHRSGIVHFQPAAIKWDQKDRTYLAIGGSRILPPKGRDFLMIAQQGDIIATSRSLHPKSKGEDRFANEVELWTLAEDKKLRRLRSLGEHWWDGGSGGVPSILAVAENGIALIDEPGGGSTMQFPVVVPPGGKPVRPFDALGWGMTEIAAVPLAFRDGIVCPILFIDDFTLRDYNSDPDLMNQFGYGTNWIAWMDGREVRLLPAPAGFLNIWRASPTQLGLSIRQGKTVHFRRVDLPPTKWWQPKTDHSNVLER